MWLKIDDRWATHPKKLRAGPVASGVWVDCAVMAASAGSDGLVGPEMLRMVRATSDLTPARVAEAAQRLVDAGLWHDAETVVDCHRCFSGDGTWAGTGHLVDGVFYFHDWREYQLDPAGASNEAVRFRERRRKRLHRNRELIERIRRRDGNLCRYCGRVVEWGPDHTSSSAPTYDHVDPWGDNDIDNVVVACKGCNSSKKDRTPDQAGMVLLAPGTSAAGS